METIEVKSSKIVSIGYDLEKQIFQVVFKNGHIYQHQQVPAIFWKECMLAPSIGKYYFNNIRETFPYELLTK